MYSQSEFASKLAAQVGKKYVLGTPSPYNKENPTAFDCSGLVCWILYHSGNGIGDTTAAGLWNKSEKVTGSLAPGDLVFLANNSHRTPPPGFSMGIGHVAVVTEKLPNGDWRIIEARGRIPGVVSTTYSYWKTRKYYAGVRRLKNFKLLTPTVVKNPGVFKVATAAQEAPRFGGPKDYAGIANFMFQKLHDCSIIFLTETDLAKRRAINAKFGPNWTRRVHPCGNDTAIFYDTDIWENVGGERSQIFFDNSHGAMRIPLKHNATGLIIDAIAVHNQPRVIASLENKQQNLQDAISLTRKNLTVIGGDFALHADSYMKLENLVRSTPDVDTFDRAGIQRTDGIFRSKGLKLLESDAFDSGKWADHDWTTATMQFPTTSSTL